LPASTKISKAELHEVVRRRGLTVIGFALARKGRSQCETNVWDPMGTRENHAIRKGRPSKRHKKMSSCCRSLVSTILGEFEQAWTGLAGAVILTVG
jgi:hypothetical protein